METFRINKVEPMGRRFIVRASYPKTFHTFWFHTFNAWIASLCQSAVESRRLVRLEIVKTAWGQEIREAALVEQEQKVS